MVSWSLRVLMLAGLAWIAGSFLGAVHPLGDSLAVFRVYVAAMTLAVALLCWRWWLGKAAVLGLAALLLHRAALGLEWSPVETPTYIVYQKNLLFRGADRRALLEDIDAAGADFLTLQEVSTANLPILAALAGTFPHQHLCEGRNIGGVAILSRWPLARVPCSEAFGLAEAVAETPEGKVRLIAVHLHWPYPYSQMRHVAQIERNLAPRGPEPVILAGDFNMVPWGQSVRRLLRETGATSTGHTEPTWSRSGVSLMIDHVFAGPDANVEIEVRPAFTSDHKGVLARIAF